MMKLNIVLKFLGENQISLSLTWILLSRLTKGQVPQMDGSDLEELEQDSELEQGLVLDQLE
jgi:hypothetical protein